jgi:2-methylisocitrate lyase-like PEP mutase family enzyme
MNLEKNKVLKDMFNKPGLIIAPGCHDALSARIIQAQGFKVAYSGGNCLMASLLGYPDIAIGSSTDMVNRAHQIASCIDIPYICDADTGYGDVNNVWHTVRAFEDAGVSGIHIEDQKMPKKCGAMDGVKVEDPAVMVGKIKAAIEARRDPNFVIIARTDAASARLGVDEVIRRLKIYAAAGADVLMPVSIENKEDNIKIGKELKGYKILADGCEMLKDAIFSDQEYEEMGFKIVTHPLSSVFLMSKVLTELYSDYKKTGTTKPYWDKMFRREDYENLLGNQEFIARSRKLNVN